MKKNISSLLQRGNLTPRERYILLIQNDIAKVVEDKEFLTEADKEGLQGWQVKTNEEAREWNRYNEGWKLGGRAGIEAEMIFMQTLSEHYRKNIVATELAIYPFYKEHLNALQVLKKIKVVDINEALEITKKQREKKLKDGIDFDYATYQLAFESLSDEIRKDILTLDEDMKYDPSYLEDEETIANLLNGKEELSKEAKEKYAELVADRGYNEFEKEYQLDGAFASLTIMEIAQKWAKDKGIKPRQKDYDRLEKIERGVLKMEGLNAKGKILKELEEKKSRDKDEWLLEEVLLEILDNYARDNKTTIKKILKETLLKWVEEGLPYPPLVISKDRDTYNGKTKLPHDELFKEWLKTKEKARETLQKLIDKGELKIKELTAEEAEQIGESYYSKVLTRGELENLETPEKKVFKIIMGESLYNFKGDYKFIKKFKKGVDRYEANAGLIYADDDPEQKGDHLDRELLIANKDKDGNVFSIFGGAIDTIEKQFGLTRYFKETTKDGETYLEFSRDDIKEAFTSAIENIKNGYAKLLAFSEIFKKLNKIYEAETDHLLNQRLEEVSEFIDTHNSFVEIALEDVLNLDFYKDKRPLKTRENLYIEKDKIAPHKETLKEWKGYFRGVFNEF